MDAESIDTANVKADAETAFILVKQWDGSWSVLTDVSTEFTIDRESFRHDVKTGCREMYEFLADDDLATHLASKLSSFNRSDSQRTSEAIRHALTERDIL
jgi:hypothetical protein